MSKKARRKEGMKEESEKGYLVVMLLGSEWSLPHLQIQSFPSGEKGDGICLWSFLRKCNNF